MQPARQDMPWNTIQMTSSSSRPYAPINSVTVRPGTAYRLSVRTKNTLTQSPKIGFRVISGSKTTGYTYKHLTPDDNRWHQEQFLYVPPEDVTELQVYLRVEAEPNGAVWWDDVTLEAVAKTLFENPETPALHLVPLESLVTEKQQTPGHSKPIMLRLQAHQQSLVSTLTVTAVPCYSSSDTPHLETQ